MHAAHGSYHPNKVVLGTVGSVEPFARTLPAKDQRATAYLCTGATYSSPRSRPLRTCAQNCASRFVLGVDLSQTSVFYRLRD